MPLTEDELNAMRTGFREVSTWYQETGVWTETETLEIGAAVKRDLDTAAADVLSCWQSWIGKELEYIRRLKAMSSGATDRVKAEVLAMRKRAA